MKTERRQAQCGITFQLFITKIKQEMMAHLKLMKEGGRKKLVLG